MSGLSIEQIIYGDDYKYEEEEEDKSEVVTEVKPEIDVDEVVENVKKYLKEEEVLNSEKEIKEIPEDILNKLEEINKKSFKIRTNYDTEVLIKEITMNNGEKFKRYKESEDENILNARWYSKNAHSKSKGKVTGYGLRVSFIENLACLDVDIKNKKTLSKEELKKKSDKLFEFIRKCNFSQVVKTASGGAHIYCNVNNFDVKGHEVLQGFASNDDYGFDLFAHDRNRTKHTNSFVMLYESQIKYSDDGEILKYTLEIGDPNKPVEPSLSYVLKCFEIKEAAKNVVKPKTPATKSENKNSDRKKFNKHNVPLTHELLNVILMGYTVEHFGGSEVIHTHTEKETTIKERPANIHLILGIKSIELMNNDLKPDEQFDINDILNKFSTCEVLTPKARGAIITDYDRFSVDDENERFVDWMMLVYILKHHAKDYYVEHLEKDFLSVNAKFLNSDVDFNYVKSKSKYFESLDHLINTYKKCLASVSGGKFYVTREYDIESKRLTLVKYTQSGMLERLREHVFIKATEEYKEKMKSQHKAVNEWNEIKLKDLIIIYYDKLPNFPYGYEIYSSRKDILSLYQPPPVTKYNPELIKNWLDFIKSLIVPDYIPALNELFSSISYKLRNPDSFIRKFFVQYGEGNDGKSYFISCLEKIFSPFCNTGIKFGQMTKDQFNEWTVKCLLLWMEEVQGNRENVDILQLSELVKQMTTPQVSVRPMYNGCKLCKNIGIIGLNTNQKDLKGLTRSDDATKSRLVIIKYQGCVAYENDPNFDFDDKCCEFIEHPDFTWSLYYYLMYEYEIPKCFKTNRYYGKEKEQFIIEANRERKRPIEAFLSDITMVDEENDYEQNNLCITYKKGLSKNKETVFRFRTTDFNITYNIWKRENESYPVIRDITLELEKKGFNKYKIKGYYFYVITKNKFETLLKDIKNEVKENYEDCFEFD